jgi:hypothetical protein
MGERNVGGERAMKRYPLVRPPTYNELVRALEAILWAEGGVDGEVKLKFDEALALLYGEEIKE